MKANKYSDLGYLKPVIKHTLDNLECMFKHSREFLPGIWLPTAGKEISFTPLLVAGAFQANMTASTEMKVNRHLSKDVRTGRLDLVIFNNKRNIADAIEVKFSRKQVKTNFVESYISTNKSIYESLTEAKVQLSALGPDLPKHFGKVALVVHRFGFRSDEDTFDENKIKELKMNAEKIAKKFYKENVSSNLLVAHRLLGLGHEVHSNKNNQGKIHCLGVLIAVERVKYAFL
jgi:hypothetical protein